MRSSCLGLLVIGLTTGALSAHACEAPASPATYVINHESLGDIGTHVLTFTCDGEDLVVETKVDVKVKILLVTAFKRKARLREVWRDNQLISYEALTQDGGDRFETRARIEDGALIVDGAEKGLRAPLEAIPSNPWNINVVDHSPIFGQRDGKLYQVNVEQGKPETLTIGGEKVQAEKYVVKGDLERELLYDADGNWLQWRLERDGKSITITRQ